MAAYPTGFLRHLSRMSSYIAHSVGVRAMPARSPENSSDEHNKEQKEYANRVWHKSPPLIGGRKPVNWLRASFGTSENPDYIVHISAIFINDGRSPAIDQASWNSESVAA